MKSVVHLITTIDRGGAEKQLKVLVLEQINLGYSVCVIPLKGSNELLDDFVDIGAQVDLSLWRKKFIHQIFLLLKFSSRNRVLFHAHLPRAELLGAICRRSNKLVGTKHAPEPFLGRKFKGLSPAVSRWTTRRMHHLIGISFTALSYMKESNQLDLRTNSSVVYYGYDRCNFDKIQFCHASLARFRIGTISRLVPSKDIFTLLKAFSHVWNHSQEFSLKILGRGEQKRELQDFANSLGISPSAITWTEHEPNVFKFFNDIDIFILTSRYEGFGLVILEAIQAEKPIITTDIPTMREILGSDFPSLSGVGDFLTIADKIVAMQDSDYVDEILALQGLRLGMFDPKIMAEKVDLIYSEVLSNFY